jgi:hypothetical protein
VMVGTGCPPYENTLFLPMKSPRFRPLMFTALMAFFAPAVSPAQTPDLKPSSEVRWPKSVRLATGLDHPRGITADEKFVYFTTGEFAGGDNAVKRVPLVGGKVDVLAVGSFLSAGTIAHDEHAVFWTTIDAQNSVPASALPAAGATLRTVAKTGGNPTLLASLPGWPTEIALDDAHAYVITSSRNKLHGQIVRAPKRGGAAELMWAGFAGLSGLHVDATSVYFTTPEGLYRAPKNGGTPTLILAGERMAIRLAGDSQNLYFFSKTSGGQMGLFKLSKSGGQPVKLAASVQSNMSIALSSYAVYFFQESKASFAGGITAYALRRVAKTGGDPETVDLGDVPSGKLTVHGDQVFFTNIDSVFRAAK